MLGHIYKTSLTLARVDDILVERERKGKGKGKEMIQPHQHPLA